MPFIPHTEDDIEQMLSAIGASSIEELFDDIPENLKSGRLSNIPRGLSEMEISRLMQMRAQQDTTCLNFIGAGAYEHHIPAAVWQITTRGEYYSAYTPYQAEASQGTLQLLYEYQTMMASLTGMDVTNASLYDGASALAEAVLMAVRSHKSSRRVLLPVTIHPVYRKVVQSIVKNQNIELIEIPYSQEAGHTNPEEIGRAIKSDVAAVIIPQPNFFGVLEQVDTLTDLAHQHGALVIGLVNPLALALLSPPGEWGGRGADIAVGEGQPLGIPLANGGPYFGFMACKQALVRQMPGRIVGRTVDVEGKSGFALTLQAREQHIRRSKATSNICTNQGLMVTAATIYMSLLGPQGLRQAASHSHMNTTKLVNKLLAIPGARRAFKGSVFHEAVIAFDTPVDELLNELTARNILGGFDLSRDYPELGNAILVCATETKTDEDLDYYTDQIREIVLDKSGKVLSKPDNAQYSTIS